MSKLLTKSIIFLFLVISTLSLETEIGFHFDNYQSPLSGSRNISSVVSVGSVLFDKYIPNNILGRIGMIYAQTLCNTFLHILNHEYYGHGFAFKNIGIGLKKINILFTNFGFPEGGNALAVSSTENVDENIFISISGSQANTYQSQQQILKHFHQNKIDVFLSNSIFQTHLDLIVYLTRTINRKKNDIEKIEDDILNWQNNLNTKYEKEVINLNNSHVYTPLLFSINAISYMLVKSTFNYLCYGDNYTEWLCFQKGEFKYLPNIRTETSLFGLAYALDNYFAYYNRSFLFSLSGLNDPLDRFLFTIDVRTHNLFESKHVDFDLRFVAARQPIEDTKNNGTYFGYMIQPSIKLKLDKFNLYFDYTNKNDVFIPAVYFKQGHYFNVGFSISFINNV